MAVNYQLGLGVFSKKYQALCRGRSSTPGAGEIWCLFLALSIAFWVKQGELLLSLGLAVMHNSIFVECLKISAEKNLI